MNPESKRSRHWDAYWASGHLTSLPQEFSGNYSGPVAEFWAGQFAALPLKTQAVAMDLRARHRSPFMGTVLGMLNEVLAMDKTRLRREQQRLKAFYLENTSARARQAGQYYRFGKPGSVAV